MIEISIIIPTYNSKEHLSFTLDSIIKQDYDLSSVEVIICDDGSSDGTKESINCYSKDLNIVYLFQEDKGFRVAKARNMGLKVANGEYTMFIDSGVVLEKSLLNTHMSYLLKNEDVLNIGYCHGFEEHCSTSNDFEVLLKSGNYKELFRIITNGSEYLDCRNRLLLEIGHEEGFNEFPWLFFWGGHISGKTNIFREVNGFDEEFVRWGGEDVELGLRLYLKGYSFNILSLAKAYHIPHEKNANANEDTTLNNCYYIHNKHNLEITKLLINNTWEEIISRTPVKC